MKEGAACNDGDACTSNDACKAGACVGKAGCTLTTLFEDAFECGKNKGWTFSAPIEKVGWAIDATPAAPAAKSPKCSLNFNNGKDYVAKVKVGGLATSPEIELKGEGTPQVSFWSYHGVEAAVGYDLRKAEVSSGSFADASKTVSVLLSNAQDKGVWKLVKIDLAKLKGSKVKVRFNFDSKDTFANTTQGWFIDDLKVEMAKANP